MNNLLCKIIFSKKNVVMSSCSGHHALNNFDNGYRKNKKICHLLESDQFLMYEFRQYSDKIDV